MSSPRPEALESLRPEGFGEEAPDADTTLIRRLAGELFRASGSVAPTVARPSAHPDVHSSAPGLALPAAPSPAPTYFGQGSDGLLSGGYPTTSPSAPPVHPTVGPLPQTTAPATGGIDRLSSGAHEPRSEHAHRFGEPRSAAGLFSGRPDTGIPAQADYYFVTPAALEGSAPASSVAGAGFDIEAVRRDFPALHQRVNGHPLVYLDNAATTHKPQAVIDAVDRFYAEDNANIHRAAHALSERATAAFEAGREKVRAFLGAADKHEIVFVRGTTEGINLVAQTYGRKHIGAGDEIILSELEHHANIVPWQLLAEQVGAVLRVIPVNDQGELILAEYAKLLGPRTKFVSVVHVSNALGTVNPVAEIIQLAHAHGVPVLVDGAQSTPHLPVNVVALDADFYVFSGHKVFGPTGIGALYGKAALLEEMPPYQGGGHMIEDVRFEKTIYRRAPEKFEAGTPDIAGVIGLGAAIDYLHRLGLPAIAAYEHALLEYATEALLTVPGLRFVGTAAEKASVLSFVIPGVPNDRIAHHLDRRGIAVRAGHHCALPSQRRFGHESTVRPSLAFYNNRADVDTLVAALHALARG